MPGPINRKRGAALTTAILVLVVLFIASVSFLGSVIGNVRLAKRQAAEATTTSLCDAGIDDVLVTAWKPFAKNQNFVYLDNNASGAADNDPKVTVAGTVAGAGAFAAGIVGIDSPDTYTRRIRIRSVGWIDSNANGVADAGEATKTVDFVAMYTLSRSKVFDYVYFVNNFGWMDGFNVNDLIVNGDMRANGDFSITNGSPTINGSLYATYNDLLSPASPGLINMAPVKWDNSTYKTNAAAGSDADNQLRWRPAYDSSYMGDKGSSTYENWRNLAFESTGSIVNNKLDGAVLADVNGERGWNRTDVGSTPTYNTLDPSATQQVVMPDLSDLSYYQDLSTNYTDTTASYSDGTTNANYGQGAWLKVWDTTLNSGAGGYSTITTSGNVTGSAVVVGTDSHPILIHGPVTFSQDIVIKGTVSGQGTIYTGRNVHVVGSIRYKTKPSFRGTDQTTIDEKNEKADMLGLAARGAVIMGDTTQFSNPYPLYYMTPPFTKGRYDSDGNWIPPYDATQKDSTGRMLYQSVIDDSTIHALSEGVNQIDAIMYTNFVGGGDIGTGGGGITINGSIICKDEAMVAFSLPMRMNYDTRIYERSMTQKALVDITLPRSPVLVRSGWKDLGFSW